MNCSLSPRLNAGLELHPETLGVHPDRGHALGFERFEYLDTILCDLSPRIVIQKGAQVGATVLAILRALWFLEARSAHTMYLFPTHRSALRFSRGRFAVMLERSPYLRQLFSAVRSAEHMRARTANFYCHGARSRTELLSTPVQYLTLDERDELYLGKLSSPQPWSAVELARQRLSGQDEAWELNLSTPTVPGRGVAAEFERSDQHHLHLLCPYCDKRAVPTWPAAIDLERHLPRFRCMLCRRPWTRAERAEAIRTGCWLPRHPERTLRGYHLSQLVAPAARAERLVEQWQAAQGRPQALQVFCNSVLGLPYVLDGCRLELRFVEEAIARGGHLMQFASQGCVLGVDVGPQRLHAVAAEPQGDALRLIWAGVLTGWEELAGLIRRLRVQSFVIDAMPETHAARALVHTFPQGYLCYYCETGPAAVNPNERVLRAPRTESLDAMFERWRLGKVSAPCDLPGEFVEQLGALVRIVREGREGQARAAYLETGADHFAHAMNYCELALGVRAGPVRFQVTPP